MRHYVGAVECAQKKQSYTLNQYITTDNVGKSILRTLLRKSSIDVTPEAKFLSKEIAKQLSPSEINKI